MNLNIGGNAQSQQSDVYAIGVNGLVKGHLEGPLDTDFVADTVTQSQSTSTATVHLKRPELPPPIGPVSLLLSINDIFNNNATLVNQTPATDQTSDDPSSTLSNQQAAYSSDFNDQLSQSSGLTQSDKDMLQFAFYNPGTVNMFNTPLSNGQSLSQVLQGLIANAQATAAQQGIDVSKLDPPVDNTAFNLNISDAYNNAFEQAVNNSDSNLNPPLTPDQKTALIFAHYNPNTPIPNADPQIMAMLPGFEATALQSIQQQFGVPPGFQPTLNSNVYNGGLKGDFQVNLQLALNDATANMSQDDITAIQDAIQNMNDPGIPPNIKAIAQQILNQAISQTQQDNNLPVGFQPSADDMKDIFNTIASNPVTTGFVQTRQLLNTTINQIQILMPDGPNKTQTLQLLEAISAAIIKAQNSIYELEMANSEEAKNESNAKLGMQQQEIRERQDQSNEVAQQTGKQQTMQQVMNVLGPIMDVFGVIMAIATGGILAAAFVILDTQFKFVDKAITGVVQGVSTAIDNGIPDNGDPNITRLKDALKAITQLAVLSAMLAAGGTVFFSLIGGGELMNIGMKMITESDVIKDFCLMCGIPDNDVQWVALAVTLAITLAITIATVVFDPEGAVTELPADTEEAALAVTDSTKAVTQVLDDTMEDVQGSVSIANKTADVAEDLDIVDSTETQNVAQQLLNDTSDTLNNTLDRIMDQVRNTRAYERMADLLDKASDKLQELQDLNPKMLTRANRVFNVIQSGTSAVNSGLQAGVSLTQANIALSKGKHEAEVAELEGMIKNLEKVLESILNNLSDLGDDLTSLKQTYGNVIGSLDRTVSQITSNQFS